MRHAHPRCRLTRLGVFALTLALLLPMAAGQGRSAAGADALTVATSDGLVRGEQHDGYRTFYGLPYAAAPTGEARWLAPQPVTSWTGVRDATASGPGCLPAATFGTPTGEVPQAEDCLYLDLTVPDLTVPEAAQAARPLPVMVWIHGGAFVAGAGREVDAARLAVGGNVLVVTINYRLGALGFLNLPGLADGGTFGLLDQQAALRWVRANIAAFGGDPANVTLFGESAGALSVCAHLVSPAARDLFQQAIIQSGPCNINWPAGVLGANLPAGALLVPPATAETASRALALSLGCLPVGMLDCLRQLTASAIQASPLTFLASLPTIAAPLLPADPAAAVTAGAFPPVPVLIGATRDELSGAGTAAAGAPDTPTALRGPASAAALRARLTASFGPAAHAIARDYADQASADPAATWGAILTDRVFACPTWALLPALAARTTVYAYEFADPAPPSPAGQPPSSGAYHSSEVQYLLPLRLDPPPLSADQRALSDAMIGYWSAFARTGNPNGADRPAWAPFSADDPTVLALAPGPGGIAPTDYAAAHHCGLWADIGVSEP